MTKNPNPQRNKIESFDYNMVFTKMKTPAAFQP